LMLTLGHFATSAIPPRQARSTSSSRFA
jgi:hypothetical protein